MNINKCAVRLLSNFSPEERSIPDNDTYPGRNDAVLEALNYGLQELFGKGKPWVRHDERGAVLHAPQTVTIAVTNGSTAGTITGWLNWMPGSTIVIEGSDVENQIRNSISSVILKFPYKGTTGSHSAIVYNDSIEVATDVLEIHKPVRLDRQPLGEMTGPYEYLPERAFADYGHSSNVEAARISDTCGTPVAYSVETWSPGDNESVIPRIRLYPAPTQTGFVDYPIMKAPPRIDDLESNSDLPVPFNFIETIFMPLATKKLRSCAFWRATTNDQQIDDDYKSALALIAKMDPAKTRPVRFTTRS